MQCPICNNTIEDGSAFCKHCGGNVQEALAASAAAAQVAQATEVMPAAVPAGEPGMDEREAKRAANAQYKDAKAEYKAARKAAGKSGAPKVIAALLGALLLVGAGGGAAWYFMTQEQRELDAKAAEAQKLAEEAEAAKAEAEERAAAAEEEAAKAREEADSAAKQAIEASTAAGTQSSSAETNEADEETNRFVGTWTGKLIETSTNYACYGAQEKPLELTVKSIDSLGKMKVDVKVLYHGHNRKDLTGDIDFHEGDVVQEWTDLTTTLQDNAFSLRIAEQDIANASDLVIDAYFTDEYSTGTQLNVSVESGQGYAEFKDVYALTKSE